MSLNYPGGLITKSPTAPTAQAAPGIWTMDQALQYIKAGTWPTPPVGEPYFNYVSLLAGTGATDGAQNNTFLDSSTNNFTITRNGNTTQGTFTPFSQADTYWSNYFNGTNSYLNVPNSSNLDLSTADYTISFWVYPTTVSGYAAIVTCAKGTSVNSNYTYVVDINNGEIRMNNYSGSSYSRITASAPIPANQWSYVFITRSGSSGSIYINGVNTTGTLQSTGNFDSSFLTVIGADYGGNASTFLNGFISNLRIVKGTALTVPTSNPTSPNTAVSGTQLLTCQSNRFADSSANAFTLTVNGTPQVIPVTPFGAPTSQYSASTNGGSGYFDGTGDWLSIPNDTAFDMGSGDFTIEGWFYQTTSTGIQGICNKYETSYQTSWAINTSGTSWDVYIYYGSTSYLTVYTGAAPALNQWNHFALERNGANIEFYVNGVRLAQVGAQTMRTTTSGVAIGAVGTGYVTGYEFDGYISNLRIIKGTAVYSGATYAIPTAPLTAISGTSLLTNFTNSGIFDYAAKNDLETVGNAQVDTAVTKYGNSMYFDGTGDWLVSPSSSLYNFGTGDFTIEYWIYLNSTSGSPTPIDHGYTGSGISANGYVFQYSSGQLKFYSNSTSITSSATDSTGTWYHYAVVRCSGTVIIYRNGLSVASGTFTNSMDYDVSLGVGSNVRAGSGFAVGDGAMNGYITNLRITKGFCRYPYNFTPPTAAFGTFYQAQTLTADPYFDYTTLLLPGNGTNGAQNNTFLDSSTNAFSITRNGNTTQGTFSPFSQTGWSNYFDGTGDYLTTSSSQVIPSGNFTIEAFVYVTSSDATQTFVSQGTGVGDSARTWMGIEDNSGAKWAIQVGGTQAISSTTPTLNTWHYVAMVYNGSTIKMYLNGSEIASANSSTNASNTTMKIGSNWGGYDFSGYISNVRVSNTARTISSTPTTAFTTDANTVFLGCQSNRFLDASTNAYALTATGNTSVQAFSPFAPTASYSAATVGGSGYFDGTTDYLTVANNAAFQFGTGDFTWEAWVYLDSSVDHGLMASSTLGSGYWALVSNSGTFYWQSANGSTNLFSASFSGYWNQWTHIVVSRVSGTTKMFFNGTQVASASDSTNYNGSAGNYEIGRDDDNSAYTKGYISGLRILKGTGSSTVTVPTTPPTNITNTSLLCNFTNAGITDATAKNDLETVGNAQISTTQSKFGGSSMYFDGTGDWLRAPSGPLTSLEGDFTVEGWVYLSSVANAWPIFTVGDSIGSTGLEVYRKTSNGKWAVFSNNTAQIESSTSTSTGSWTHIAVVRYGGVVKLYVNGNNEGSSWSTTGTFSGAVYVAAEFYNSSVSVAANGYINDLRITKGIARYTQSFTPPTSAFLTL